MPAPTLITDTEVQGLLKRGYDEFRTDLFPMSTPLLAAMRKGGKSGPRHVKWGGEDWFGDAIMTRPLGMTASSAGYLPYDVPRTEKQFRLSVNRLYVTRQLDGLAITGTQDRRTAFASIVRKALDEIKAASKLGMQEILNGDGSGIKALVGAVTDTTHFTAISPYGISGGGEGGLLLDVGLTVAVHNGTSSTIRGRTKITTCTNSGDTATLVVDTAVTGVTAGDAMYACTANDSARNSYPNGLVNITNRGGNYNNFETLSAATDARWDAGARLVAGTDTPDATQPTQSDISRLIMKVASRSGNDARETPDEFLLITTPGIHLKLAESYYGQVRYGPNDYKELKGGYLALRICGVAAIQDPWLPAGTVYLIHLPSALWVDAKDWTTVLFNDSNAWRPISGRDAYETSWGSYLNIGADQRNAHGSITGYIDTERFSHVM